jgi:predicted nucleotidyltransferase
MTRPHPRLRTLSADRRERFIQQLNDLLEGRREILLALLHGSFQVGRPFRDVDVALYVDPGAVPRGAFREYELEHGVRWSADLGLPVDVRVLNDAPVSFRYHALKGEVLLVREPDFLDDFRARTWDDYCDFVPFAKQYLREAIGE